MTPELNEIISEEQIKLILKSYTGQRQLIELKFYFITFKDELKEIGVDPVKLAWQIYKTDQK